VALACDAEAVEGSVSSGDGIRLSVPVPLREIPQFTEDACVTSLTTCSGHQSPATLLTAKGGCNRHQPTSNVAVPADIHGGDAAAENYPSVLIDALAVRT
jgi:hypothetical protein